MSVLIALRLLRLRALARLGLAPEPPRFVTRWVTDAETGKLFCIWLAEDAAPPRSPATPPSIPDGECGQAAE